MRQITLRVGLMRAVPLHGPVLGVRYAPDTNRPGRWRARCLDCGQRWDHDSASPHARGCPGVPVRSVTVRESTR